MRSARTSSSASHAASEVSGAASTRAHSHHNGPHAGVMMQQPAARDHETGGIVVELGQAVGRLGHQRAVVGAVAGDRPQSLERHHRDSP